MTRGSRCATVAGALVVAAGIGVLAWRVAPTGRRAPEDRDRTTAPPVAAGPPAELVPSGRGHGGAVPAPGPRERPSVRVRVIAEAGEAIPVAAFLLARSEVSTAVVGTTGEIVELPLPAAWPDEAGLSLGVVADGYARTFVERPRVADPSGVIEVRLSVGLTLRGRVRDEEGHPVAGIPLLATSRREVSLSATSPRELETDQLRLGPEAAYSEARGVTSEDGSFELRGLRRIGHVVRSGDPRWFLRMPSRDPRAGGGPPGYVMPGETDVELTAYRTVRVDVALLQDEANDPVPDGQVELRRTLPSGGTLTIATESRDGVERASFPAWPPELAGQPQGEIELMYVARAVGWATVSGRLRIPPGAWEWRHVIRMRPVEVAEAEIRVRAHDRGPTTLPMLVVVEDIDGGACSATVEPTSTPGTLRVRTNAGRHRLRVHPRPPAAVSLLTWEDEVDWSAPRPPAVEIVLDAYATLRLRAPDDGAPRFIHLRREGVNFVTAIEGRERVLAGMPVGPWRYRILDGTSRELRAGTVDLAAGDDIALEVKR